MSNSECVDCGIPIGQGAARCLKHRGIFIRRRSLRNTAERDVVLLGMVEGEGLTAKRLADRLGISRPQANSKIKLARSRRAQRADLGIVTEGVPHG